MRQPAGDDFKPHSTPQPSFWTFKVCSSNPVPDPPFPSVGSKAYHVSVPGHGPIARTTRLTKPKAQRSTSMACALV
eukprot:918494-Amphidinium_carterae.1